MSFLAKTNVRLEPVSILHNPSKTLNQKQPFADVFKIGVVKSFLIFFKKKHLCLSLLKKVRLKNLLKRDFNPGVFL